MRKKKPKEIQIIIFFHQKEKYDKRTPSIECIFKQIKKNEHLTISHSNEIDGKKTETTHKYENNKYLRMLINKPPLHFFDYNILSFKLIRCN